MPLPQAFPLPYSRHQGEAVWVEGMAEVVVGMVLRPETASEAVAVATGKDFVDSGLRLFFEFFDDFGDEEGKDK